MKKILAYAVIYTVWGTTYFFIKLAVKTIPPFYILAVRFFLGGIGLLIFSMISQTKTKTIISKKSILSSILIGVLLLIGGNGLVTIAEQRVDSYLAVLIISTIPLVVMVSDWLILKKKITLQSIIGIALGSTGIVILLSDNQNGVPVFNSYSFLILCAVIFWSAGTTLSKKIPVLSDSFMNSAVQQLSVGIISFIAIQPFSPVWSIDWYKTTVISWLSLLYLAVFGSLALACYAYLLKHEPNNRVVTYTFVNPLIAIIIGICLGGETPVSGLSAGTFLILLALTVLFYGKKISDFIKKE